MSLTSRPPRTTTAFITDLATRLFWPTLEAARPLSNSKILALASGVIRTLIWPELKDAREDYVTMYIDIPVGINGGDTQEAGNAINIPSQSYLQIDRIWYLPGTSSTEPRYEILRADMDDLNRRTTGFPRWYAFRGGRAVIEPYPTTGYFRVKFHVRPPDLGVYTASDTVTYREVFFYSGTSIVTYVALPDAWVGANDIAILAPTPPHTPIGFIDSANILSHAGSTLVFDSPIQFPSSVRENHPAPVGAGDLIVELPNIGILPIPDEAYEFLIWETVMQIAVARGDTARIQSVGPMIAQARGAFLKALQPRETADGQVYVPEDRASLYTYGYGYNRWRY